MYGNDFWLNHKVEPDTVVYETAHYLVVVTPKVWRDQARSSTDRNLQEYTVINKLYRTLETGSNNLPTAIQYVVTLESTLEQVLKEKEKPSAVVVGIKSKNNPGELPS